MHSYIIYNRCSCANVGICSINVGVGMVTKDMLVDPVISRCSVKERMSEAYCIPNPRLVSNGKVTGNKVTIDS